jgi:leucyl aminopeptidase
MKIKGTETMFEVIPAKLTNRTSKKHMVVLVEDKLKLTPEAKQINDILGGQLLKTLKLLEFKGKKGTVKGIYGINAEGVQSVVAVGVGKLNKLKPLDWLRIGVALGKELNSANLKDVAVLLGSATGSVKALNAAQQLVEGMYMGEYRFVMKKKDDHTAAGVNKLTVFTDSKTSKNLAERIPYIKAVAEAQSHTRKLMDLPPNIANPEYMAEQARELKKLKIKVEVIEEEELNKMGMNLMMAVGGGSAKKDQPRLVIMKYEGAGKDQPYRALVGKGVMFDTGGYNLKPSGAINGMKCDMGGASVVFGTMKAIAQIGLPVNVIGVMGCVMNMISKDAYLPDAVITGYNGKTVEIGNTDAEGRMVLADAMAYTIDKYNPTEVIDIATLTGACMVALGAQYCGMFSHTERMVNALNKASAETGEPVWRLPEDDAFYPKSSIADLNNAGSRFGGASYAAVFLKQFVGKTPWTHLDIAGVGFAEKQGMNTYVPVKGATGFGVRLLTKYLENEAAKTPKTEKSKSKRTKKTK